VDEADDVGMIQCAQRFHLPPDSRLARTSLGQSAHAHQLYGQAHARRSLLCTNHLRETPSPNAATTFQINPSFQIIQRLQAHLALHAEPTEYLSRHVEGYIT